MTPTSKKLLAKLPCLNCGNPELAHFERRCLFGSTVFERARFDFEYSRNLKAFLIRWLDRSGNKEGPQHIVEVLRQQELRYVLRDAGWSHAQIQAAVNRPAPISPVASPRPVVTPVPRRSI